MRSGCVYCNTPEGEGPCFALSGRDCMAPHTARADTAVGVDALSIALQRAGVMSPTHMSYHDIARCVLAAVRDGRDDLGAPDEHRLHDYVTTARSRLPMADPLTAEGCPKCGHPHLPMPGPWRTSNGTRVNPVCDWPMGAGESCDCHRRTAGRRTRPLSRRQPRMDR